MTLKEFIDFQMHCAELVPVKIDGIGHVDHPESNGFFTRVDGVNELLCLQELLRVFYVKGLRDNEKAKAVSPTEDGCEEVQEKE